MRLLFIVFLSVFSCLSSTADAAAKAPVSRLAAGSFTRNPVLPKWAEGTEQLPETTFEEPLVIRLAEVQYWTGPNPAYLVNRAVQVNSSSRLSEIGQFSIEFLPAYQKVILHRIAIVRGKQVLDRTQTADVRVLDRETDAEKGFYFGAASVQVLLSDIAPGDTLWVTYSVDGRNPVFGSMWTETLPWTKVDPIDLRKTVVISPSSRPLQWQVSGTVRHIAPPVIEQRGAITRMTFKERAVAAEELEASLPPSLMPLPVLDFTEYKDWAQVNRWSLSLFPDASKRPEVQALARRFDGKTVEDRASQALHWVQDDIRYFSVSIGENSHRPQSPEVVMKRRFGDCKDKSQLLVALYSAMGLQARPVLVNSAAPTLPAQFLPSPNSFNHAIVRVVLDGKAYFVDPTRTHERGRISHLPAALPGAAALVVDDATVGLTVLPEEVIDVPLMERTERMIISGLHGDGQLNVRTEYRGRLAAPMRDAYRALSSFDLKKLLLSEVERTYPGIQLRGVPDLSDSTDGTGFVVQAQLTIPVPLKDEDGHFKLPFRSHVFEHTLGMPDKLVRKHPLWLAAGHYRARYNLDVSLPNAARLVQHDDDFSLNTRFLEAHSQLTWRGSHLDYYIDYAIKNPEVPASDLPGFDAELQKLGPLFENKLDFVPVTVPPETAREVSLRLLDIMSKLSTYEDLQEEALRTGKIPEIKLDDATFAKLNYRALCDSLVDLYSVRNWNPLLMAPAAALRKIIDAKSDRRSKQLCEARALFIDYNLMRASKFLASLRTDDDDALTLMQAWADFHAGDKVRATENLSRFLKAKGAAGLLSARDAGMAFALARRLGLSEPPEVRKLVQTLRTDAWPMPIFSLLRGELPADDLLKAIDRLPLAAREYATLEAHFFISQAYLASNEPRKADLHVNWLIRSALVGSDYEILAHADRYGDALNDPNMGETGRSSAALVSSSVPAQHLKAAAERGIALAEYRLSDRYLKGQGVKQDTARALALLESASAKGLGDAFNDLGIIYTDGKYVPKDDPRGLAYYRQAIEQGNSYAAYNLGRYYWFGEHGLPIDYSRAFQLFRDAAEMEDENAQFFLSRIYFDGNGAKKNDLLARFWAVQSHFHKSPDGTAQLGRILLLSEPDNEVRQVGLRLLAYAARQNNSFAQMEYGRVLLDGIGVEPDAKSAFRLIQAASLQNNDRATALLGRMYVEGLGVKADAAKGMGLLNKLEQAAQPDAYYELGLLYRSDTSGMTDKTRAAEYFRRGAGKGQQDSAEMFAVMLQTGEGVVSDLAEAARYYQIAVEAGRPRAMNNLAYMYERGEGVPVDLQRSMALYRNAAQLGNIPAMLNLAELHAARSGESASLFVPLAYYMLASRFGLQEAAEGLQRLKAKTDPETIQKAQKFATGWKPGKAMPDDA
jgi:TPR repeat protein/transglutaminase-like putative cysteine protease